MKYYKRGLRFQFESLWWFGQKMIGHPVLQFIERLIGDEWLKEDAKTTCYFDFFGAKMILLGALGRAPDVRYLVDFSDIFKDQYIEMFGEEGWREFKEESDRRNAETLAYNKARGWA